MRDVFEFFATWATAGAILFGLFFVGILLTALGLTFAFHADDSLVVLLRFSLGTAFAVGTVFGFMVAVDTD